MFDNKISLNVSIESVHVHPHLSLWSPPSCPCPPLEHCCLILSSWKSERYAAPSAPFHCRQVSCVIGWLVAGFAVFGPAAERPVSPGNLLGWGLMKPWWAEDCWLGLVYNDSVRMKQITREHMQTTVPPTITSTTLDSFQSHIITGVTGFKLHPVAHLLDHIYSMMSGGDTCPPDYSLLVGKQKHFRSCVWMCFELDDYRQVMDNWKLVCKQWITSKLA